MDLEDNRHKPNDVVAAVAVVVVVDDDDDGDDENDVNEIGLIAVAAVTDEATGSSRWSTYFQEALHSFI